MVDVSKKYIVPCTLKHDFEKLNKNTSSRVCSIVLDKNGFITCIPDNQEVYDNMVFVQEYFVWLLCTHYIVEE
jgi:hypothetical protein